MLTNECLSVIFVLFLNLHSCLGNVIESFTSIFGHVITTFYV